MSDDRYGDPWSRGPDPHEQWRGPARAGSSSGSSSGDAPPPDDEPPIWEPEPMPAVRPSDPDARPGSGGRAGAGYPDDAGYPGRSGYADDPGRSGYADGPGRSGYADGPGYPPPAESYPAGGYAPGGYPDQGPFPPYPGGGGYPPGGPPPPPPPPRSNRTTLVLIWTVVGIVVLAAIGVSVFLIVRSSHSDDSNHAAGSTSPSASHSAPPTGPGTSSGPASSTASSRSTSDGTADDADAATAARAVDKLIDASVSARSGVQPALNHIGDCKSGDADIAALQKAADTRRGLITQLQAVDLDALPQGDQLKSSFATVLSTSASADDEYVKWGRDQQGCSGHAADTSAKRAGDADSTRATAAKRTFLQKWNPIAKARGLATRKQGDI